MKMRTAFGIEVILIHRGGDDVVAIDLDSALAEQFDRLLRLLFLTDGPPHQLMAFILVKLLEWKPDEILSKVSDIALLELATWLEEQLLITYGTHGVIVKEGFKHLEPRLRPGRTVSEVAVDGRTWKTYPYLRDRVLAETTLRDYYTANPSPPDYPDKCAENITTWCISIQRRVFSAWETQREPAA